VSEETFSILVLKGERVGSFYEEHSFIKSQSRRRQITFKGTDEHFHFFNNTFLFLRETMPREKVLSDDDTLGFLQV